MKIAITGANGFIGSYLINRLKRQGKIELYCFDRKKTFFIWKEKSAFSFSFVLSCL